MVDVLKHFLLLLLLIFILVYVFQFLHHLHCFIALFNCWGELLFLQVKLHPLDQAVNFIGDKENRKKQGNGHASQDHQRRKIIVRLFTDGCAALIFAVV